MPIFNGKEYKFKHYTELGPEQTYEDETRMKTVSENRKISTSVFTVFLEKRKLQPSN